MSLRQAVVLFAAITIAASAGVGSVRGQEGQGEIVRRAKTKIAPVYPDLARKMNLSGTVRVEVLVATNGTVKDAKVVGGHPVLATAALEAVRKWRFEPATLETSGVVDIKFERRQ